MNPLNSKPSRRVKTPVLIQMESVECGAVALAIVLAHYKKHVPTEEIRQACGVTRDGVSGARIVEAARHYGLNDCACRVDLRQMARVRTPAILFWEFNHFVVFEGCKENAYFINDPAIGRRRLSEEEFSKAFTGAILVFEPKDSFAPSGRAVDVSFIIRNWLAGAKTNFTFLILIGLFSIIPGLVIPTFSRVFVDEILVQRMSDWIVPLIFGLISTAAVRAITEWVQKSCLLRFNESRKIKSSADLMYHILTLPMRFFTHRSSGEIASRISLTQNVTDLLIRRISESFLSALLTGLFAIMMVFYDVALTLVVLASSGISCVTMLYFAEKIRTSQVTSLQAHGNLSGHVVSSLNMIETIKANGGEDDFFHKTIENQVRLINAKQKQQAIGNWLNYFLVLNNGLATAVVLVFGACRILDGAITVGMLVAFQSLMASFLRPIDQLVRFANELQRVIAITKRIEDVKQYRADRHTQFNFRKIEPCGVQKIESLRLLGVRFGYNRGGEALLEDVNLDLCAGKRIAVVGRSGSGKSTLAKLVCGHYDPWDGEVLFDGEERDQTSRLRWTQSVAHVDQRICLFEGSIKNNITLWDDTIEDPAILRACKDACIHEAVMQRKDGYEHIVEENGRNFSGGERQRLEIARALAVEPRILILDEATGAVDPATESEIYQNLRMRGCACLVIAHRLSAIRDCDEIIVLDHGKICGRGRHELLIERCEEYEELIINE